MSAHEAAARGCSSKRGAENGVATQSAGAGPCRTQISVRQRGPILLRANGRRQ